MFRKQSTIVLFLNAYAISGSAMAAFNPNSSAVNYQIFEAGYHHAMPLHEKLSQRQGELFFKNSGLFVGASDPIYKNDLDSEENHEIDAYAGIKKDMGLFGYHFGVKSYNSSIQKDLELQEYFVGGSIKNLSFSYASNQEGEYTQLNLSHSVSSITLGVHLGETMRQLGDTYTDWSLRASKAFKDVTVNAIMSNSEDPAIKGTEFNLGVEKIFKWF